jgi:hypothetical protein
MTKYAEAFDTREPKKEGVAGGLGGINLRKVLAFLLVSGVLV